MDAKKKSTSTKKIILAAAALVALVAILIGCWLAFGPKGTAGSKTISVEVTFADESTKDFTITTNEEFLRGALEQEKLIEGSESDYGLYVLTVDGQTADEAQQQWWRFDKDGQMLETGVDTTPVADGDNFEIVLVTGWN